ncbi:MAG: transcription antitermination factor NusB [Nitrospinae bacterium]|nr:transcription antitermination factor NusB [Nitrospinota bacterium]
MAILYQADLRPGEDAASLLEDHFAHAGSESQGDRAFVEALVYGVLRGIKEIDEALGAALQNWTVERLGCVERAILRLGVFELLRQPATPPKVAVDEAVRLAKTYAQEESAGLVNGVLDRIMNERRPQPPTPGTRPGALGGVE